MSFKLLILKAFRFLEKNHVVFVTASDESMNTIKVEYNPHYVVSVCRAWIRVYVVYTEISSKETNIRIWIRLFETYQSVLLQYRVDKLNKN